MKRALIILPGIILIVAGVIIGIIVIRRVMPKPPCFTVPADLPTGGTWTMGVSIPIIRAETTAAELNGKFYMAGGIEKGYGGTTNFDVFDPATNTWTTLASIPMAIHHAGLIGLNDKLYLIGGYDDIGKMLRAEPDIASTWVYDPAADSWSSIADMPAPRAAQGVVALDGKIYAVAGTGTGAQDIWIYDPATDTWDDSPRAQLSIKREHVSAYVVDGKIYVVGGRWANVNIASVEIYDPATDTWTNGAEMPHAASGYMGAVLNDQIHVFGGEQLLDECIVAAHQVYDPSADSWSLLSNPTINRHGGAGAAVDGKWYIVGGSMEVGVRADVSITEKMEIFTPDA